MRRVSFRWMLGYGAGRAGLGMHDIFFNAVAGFFLVSYGLPNWAVGFLANERSFVGSVLQPVVGAVSDRIRTPIGRRKPFLLLIAPVVVGFLVLMTRPEGWVVIAVFLVGPLCLSIAVVAYEVLLPDCVVPERRGTVNGVNRMLGFMSGMGLLVLAWRLWEAQPSIVFLAVAGSLAVGFLITFVAVHEPEPRTRTTPPLRLDPAIYLRGVLAHREAAKYVGSYFLFWFGIGGITPFVTRFGNEELGIPVSETFLLLVVVIVATLLFSVPSGWLGDHVGKKVVTSWGIAAFGILILVGSQVGSMTQAVVVLGAAGVAQAVPTVLAYPLFTELVPSRRMGELSGWSAMVWSLAQPLGATVFGAMADLAGTLRAVFLGGGAAVLLSWAVLQTVRVERIGEVLTVDGDAE